MNKEQQQMMAKGIDETFVSLMAVESAVEEAVTAAVRLSAVADGITGVSAPFVAIAECKQAMAEYLRRLATDLEA